jgi:hypothetical protein
MGKRTLSPAGLIAVAAALCVMRSIPAGAGDKAHPSTSPASDAATGIHSTGPYPDETPFLAENSVAMDKMMAGMNVRPTGDADADFAAMMIPHHQGAIDMAVAELRYGKNERLRRIAQEIIVDQQQEIAAMRLALGQQPPASAPAPTQVPAGAPFPGAPSPGAPSPGAPSPGATSAVAPSPVAPSGHATMSPGSMSPGSMSMSPSMKMPRE